MRYLLILAHPDKNSFNRRIADRLLIHLNIDGNEVILHNLYKENFNPVLSLEEINRKFSFDEDIQRCSLELTEADHLIFVHPDWWGQPIRVLQFFVVVHSCFDSWNMFLID